MTTEEDDAGNEADGDSTLEDIPVLARWSPSTRSVRAKCYPVG